MSDRIIGFKYILDSSDFRKGNADVEKNVAATTKTLEANANQQAAAISNTTRAAQQAANTQSAAMTSAAQAVRSYDKEIATARVEIAQLAQRHNEVAAAQGRNSTAAQELRAQMSQQSVATRGLVAEKQLLAIEARAEEAANKTAAASQAALAASSEATGGAFSKLTTRINVGRGALSGWDSVIEGVVRAGGGIQLQWAILISLASILLPKIIDLASGKRKLVEISKDLIETDLALAGVFSRLAGSSADVDGALGRQAERYREVVKADISALLTSYVAQYRELAASQDENKRATEANTRAVEASEKSTRVAIVTGDEYGQTAFANTQLQRHWSTAVEEGTVKQGELQKKVGASVEALVLLYRTGLISEQQLYAGARAAGADADALAFLRGEIERTTSAQEQLNAAVQNFHPVALNTNAQAAIVRQMQEGLAKDIAGGASLAQVEPRIKALQKAAAELASSEAASAGTALSFNEAHRRTRDIMLDDFNVLAPYVDKLPIYEKNLSNATAAKEKHVKASHANAQAMREENAVFNLQKELLTAQERLGKENFDQQAALFVQEMAERKRHFLEAAKLQKLDQDTQAKGIDLLKQITIARLDYIAQKEKEHTQKLADEHARRLESGRKEREQMEKQYYEGIRRMEQAEANMTAFLEEEEIKRTQAVLKAARDQAQARTAAGKFLLSQGRGASSDETTRFLNQLKQLGPEFNDVDQSAAKVRQAIDYVSHAFGFAAHSAQMFDLQLEILSGQSVSSSQIFSAAWSEALKQVKEEWLESGEVFQFVAQGISYSLAAMVANGEDFGSNMKGVFFDLIAAVAQQFGSLFISMGAGMLFVDPAAGIGLIVAGTALLALSGLMHGLAQKSHRAASQQAAAAGGGNAGQVAASGAGSSAPKPPIRIPFDSTPPPPRNDFSRIGWTNPDKPQEQTTIIQLSDSETRNFLSDLLEKKGVVTIRKMEGNSHVRRTIKAVALS